jgi:hypothetical protein
MEDRREFLKDVTVAVAGMSVGASLTEVPPPPSVEIKDRCCAYILWVPKKDLTPKQVAGVVRSRVLEVIKHPDARDPMSMKSWPSGFKPLRMDLVDFYEVPQFMMGALPFKPKSKLFEESVYAFKFMVTGTRLP